MDSNLVTPPDIVSNGSLSVLLVEPEQTDLDAVIRFCQYTDESFNVFVYIPNMDDLNWLYRAAQVCDTIIVNSESNDHKQLCLMDKTYYYGNRVYLENPRKITDPLHYFASKVKGDK